MSYSVGRVAAMLSSVWLSEGIAGRVELANGLPWEWLWPASDISLDALIDVVRGLSSSSLVENSLRRGVCLETREEEKTMTMRRVLNEARLVP